VIVRLAALVVTAGLLATACESAISGRPLPPTRSAPSPSTLPTTPPTTPPTTAATSPGAAFRLDVVSGAKLVRIQAAELPGQLYRVATSSGTAVSSSLDLSARSLRVALTGTEPEVSITLDSATAWQLRLQAGVAAVAVDMRAGHLAGFTAEQGVGTMQLELGAPAGAVRLSVGAGMSSFTAHVPDGTAVRVTLHAGAGTVRVFGETHQGVPAGSSFASGSGADSYSVDAVGGVGTLVVD
jgi:hypothetical protein